MKKEIKKEKSPKVAKTEPAAQPAQAPEASRSARAIAKYLRISPRKVRPVINAIRRRPAHHAASILAALPQKAARLAEKVLKSAVANAKVLQLDEGRLYISDIRADGGPTMKRFMSRSMGRADRMLRRSTHLSVILKEGIKQWTDLPMNKPGEAPEKKSQSAKAPAKKLAAKAGA